MTRASVWFIAVALLLTGCAASPVESARDFFPPQPSSEEASSGADLPAHDPALALRDSAGRTPEDAVLLLIETLNARQWKAAYSMYATPSVDVETAARERDEAGETYIGFKVLETRVVDEAAAFVRVTYSVRSEPEAEISVDVIVSEPGEWWPLHQVDGVWKIQWLPRQ